MDWQNRPHPHVNNVNIYQNQVDLLALHVTDTKEYHTIFFLVKSSKTSLDNWLLHDSSFHL